MVAVLGAAPDAEACSWLFEAPQMLSYGDFEAPPESQVVLVGTPGSAIFTAELWSQDPNQGERTGEPIEATKEVLTLPNLGVLGVITPSRRIGADERVTVWVADVGSGAEWLEVGAFLGGAGQPPSPPPPPTALTWYDERLEETINDSCTGPFRELAYVEVEPVADANLRWLRVTFRDAAGEARDFALLPSRDGPTGGSFHVPSGHDTRCVEVRAVGVDGRQSAPLTQCIPDRCATSPGGIESWPHTPVDWDAVEDGCNLRCTPNEVSGYTCEDGDWPDPTGLDAAEGGCACRASPRARPWSIAGLGALALLLYRRRRR